MRSVRPGEAPALVARDTVVSLRIEMHDAQGVEAASRLRPHLPARRVRRAARRARARARGQGAGRVGHAAARARAGLRRVRRRAAARRARRALRRGHRGRHGGRGGFPFLHGHRRRRRQGGARRQPSARRHGAALLLEMLQCRSCKAGGDQPRGIIALGGRGNAHDYPVVRRRHADRVRAGRRTRLRLHQRHHAEEARRAAQLPGDRPPALLLRGDRRVFPAVLLRRRPRRDAVQPRDARLGVPPGEERGRRDRLRLDLRPAPAGRADLRQPSVPGARGGAAADAVAGARRGLLPRAVRGAIDRQRERHELRRDLGAGGALAVARRERRRLLDGHRRGRPLALSPRGRLRHHHADRHRQVRRARRAGQSLRGAAAGTIQGRQGIRDQAVAGREAGQGRRAARRQGDRRDRADPRHSRKAATRSARTAIATSPT